MTFVDFLILLVVAGIIGALGQAIGGYSTPGCAMSVVIGFVGAIIISGVGTDLGWQTLVPIVAAALWATTDVLTKYLALKGESPETLTISLLVLVTPNHLLILLAVWALGIAAPGLLPAGLANNVFAIPTGTALWLLMLLGVLTGIAQYLLAFAYKVADATYRGTVPPERLARVAEHLDQLAVRHHLVLDQLDVRDRHGQRIVQLVRDARRERRHARDPIDERPLELPLERLERSDQLAAEPARAHVQLPRPDRQLELEALTRIERRRQRLAVAHAPEPRRAIHHLDAQQLAHLWRAAQLARREVERPHTKLGTNVHRNDSIPS